MSQLADLAKPFTAAYIETKPGPSKASYVEHNFVVERLLLHLGGYSWELVEILRGDFTYIKKGRDGKPDETVHLTDIVHGVVYRLSAEIDGRLQTIEEVGEVEHPGNWGTDGARMKVAASDALKRCAMRLGLGLHLWSGNQYFLAKMLEKAEDKP